MDFVKETTTEYRFRQWCCYFAREPSAGERLDFWSAQLLAAAVNPHRGKGQSAVRPESLMPRRWPVPRQNENQVADQVMAWARGMARKGAGDGR